MKTVIIRRIFAIVLVLSTIIGFFLILLYYKENARLVDVPCYDRFGSEIKGLSCEKYQYRNEWGESIITLSFSIVLMSMIVGVNIWQKR